MAEVVGIPGYVAGTWVIDPVHSTVSFTIRHLMVSKVRGSFGALEGEIITGVDPLDSSVTAAIDVTLINTNNRQRDDHIRSADFFEVERYPTSTFRSTGVRRDGEYFLLDGELTIKAVTHPVTFKLEVDGFGPDAHREDPMAGARAGFSATAELNRTDFDVTFNSPIPGGGVALSEKVQITVEIEAALITHAH
ncbi:YceI family protein [Amycolatopsis sp. DSM 110486]|uniref:YceI family protein n=1 Tax=Amycolatopsis sp. DSM 110486 TaxID=2865832 RepID=UPI001C6A3274|nr:YceI family protein [Amycolatopsis sp. DSM 110486]QYN18994.1 YceI family protein [Amycolatopsis sp. DSM 110486]